MGVSISVFNLVSKMFNIPLLNVTTSFVAEAASEESSGVDTLVNSESSPLLSADGKLLAHAICHSLRFSKNTDVFYPLHFAGTCHSFESAESSLRFMLHCAPSYDI